MSVIITPGESMYFPHLHDVDDMVKIHHNNGIISKSVHLFIWMQHVADEPQQWYVIASDYSLAHGIGRNVCFIVRSQNFTFKDTLCSNTYYLHVAEDTYSKLESLDGQDMILKIMDTYHKV